MEEVPGGVDPGATDNQRKQCLHDGAVLSWFTNYSCLVANTPDVCLVYLSIGGETQKLNKTQ